MLKYDTYALITFKTKYFKWTQIDFLSVNFIYRKHDYNIISSKIILYITTTT